MLKSKQAAPSSTRKTEHRKSSLSSLWKTNEVFLINLVCPNNNIMAKVHNVKETFQDIIIDACRKLGIEQPELFGIASSEHNEYKFISGKKALQKVLPECLIVTNEQASQLNGIETRMVLDSTIKSSRLYLRMKHFYVNIDQLTGKTLSFCYEQVRLDTLKYQNWLHLEGHEDVLHEIAAKCLWLTYEKDSLTKVQENQGIVKHFLPQIANLSDSANKLIERLKQIEEDTDQSGIELYHYSTDTNNDSYETFSDDSSNFLPIMGEKKVQRTSTSSTSSQNQDNIADLIKDLAVYQSITAKQDLMVEVLKEALKLPYFGTHFYQVEMIREERQVVPNCRLGIGPLGITLYCSSDFTTWGEVDSWGWRRIEEINFHKNILQLNESADPQPESINFQCISEAEAKYLFNHCKEIHLFQIQSIHDAKSRKWAKKSSDNQTGSRVKGHSVGNLFSAEKYTPGSSSKSRRKSDSVLKYSSLQQVLE